MSTQTLVSQAAPAAPAATRLTMYALSTDTTPTMMSKDSASNIRVMANIPGTTNTYDLGSSGLKWKDLYIAGTSSLGGAVTVVAGGLTVTAGGLTVTAGGLTVTAGGLTVSASGITVTGTSTITGTLSATLGFSTAEITLTAADSQIIPGVTSFRIRNNANSASNLSITDAGVATVRAGLVVTAGLFNPSAASVPQCDLYRTVDQDMLVGEEDTIQFNAEYTDTDTMHSTVANTNRITFTTAGTYLIQGSFVIIATGAATAPEVRFRDSAAALVRYFNANIASGQRGIISFSFHWKSSDSSYLDLVYYADVATTIYGGASRSHLTATRISAS